MALCAAVGEAFVLAQEVAGGSDRFPEVLAGAGGGLSQAGLQLCDGHLDRVEVGAGEVGE